MAIVAVILASVAAFIWHAAAAYPSCSRDDAIKTSDEAIRYTIEFWTNREGIFTSPEDNDETLLEMIRSDDFRSVSSKNWIVRTEPTFFYNQAWYVRYWDHSKHMSIVREFDKCRNSIKEEYDLVYRVLFD